MSAAIIWVVLNVLSLWTLFSNNHLILSAHCEFVTYLHLRHSITNCDLIINWNGEHTVFAIPESFCFMFSVKFQGLVCCKAIKAITLLWCTHLGLHLLFSPFKIALSSLKCELATFLWGKVTFIGLGYSVWNFQKLFLVTQISLASASEVCAWLPLHFPKDNCSL